MIMQMHRGGYSIAKSSSRHTLRKTVELMILMDTANSESYDLLSECFLMGSTGL